MMEALLDGLIALSILAVLALITLILKEVLGRRLHPESVVVHDEGGEKADSMSEEDKPDEAKPYARQESESERLKRTEKELAERESKVKAERIRELRERESVIKRRETDEAAKPVAADAETDTGRLRAERERLEEMVKKAEERFASGELEERNYKMIVSDYQAQILDIDVKIRRGGG